MAEYMNPFAGSLLPEQVPNNAFESGINQSQNQRMMSPFIGMEQLRQQRALDKQQVMDQEFMSEPARTGRLAGIQAKTDEARLESEQAKKKIQMMPQEQQLETLQMAEKIRGIQEGPAKEWVDFSKGLYKSLVGKPYQTQAMIYAGELKSFLDQHPDWVGKLPADVTNFTPTTMQHLEHQWNASVLTPKHAQDIENENIKGQWALKGHEASAKATLGAAAIGAASHERIAAKQIEAGKMNTMQELVRSRRLLKNPDASPEDLEVAEANIEADVRKRMKSILETSGQAKGLDMAVAQRKKGAAEEYDKVADNLYEKELLREGVVARMEHPTKKDPKTGRPEVQFVPRSKQKQAVAAGFKFVK